MGITIIYTRLQVWRFQVFECQGAFQHPIHYDLIPFERFEEREASVDCFRYKVVQCRYSPCQAPNLLLSPWLGYINEGLDFFRLASMPLCLTIKPKNLPEPTPNTYLAEFNFIPYSLKMAKVLARFVTCWSTYISMLLLVCSANIWLTSLIFESERHDLIAVCAPIGDKGCAFLVGLVHPNLVIP